MEGDFTRSSDDQDGTYSGVLMQQGRVQLDSDWNEQAAIQTRALRDALGDLIGPHGGPTHNLGFAIATRATNDPALTVGIGAYYVDGIRVQQRNDAATFSMARRDKGSYLVFLDVWERHVNVIEDPRIREIALLGPDTATRSEVLWRVRLMSFENSSPTVESPAEWADMITNKYLRGRPRRQLAARAITANTNTDPCQLSPLSQYRGRENQLYRVQIHDGWPTDVVKVPAPKTRARSSGNRPPASAPSPAAPATDAKPADQKGQDAVLFTFKWSRDNGSVVFPIVRVVAPESPAAAGDQEIEVTVEVGHLGRDERYGLVAGDIVEFVHDALTRETLDETAFAAEGRDPGRAGLLGRVLSPIDRDDLTVRIAVYADDIAEIAEGTLHPYLRRWDHRATADRKLVRGAIPVRQSDLDKWLPLEDGVEVLFAGPSKQQQPLVSPEQRAGDYWQIPARTATGDVIWPTTTSGTPPTQTPLRLPPHGPHHHYAPLAIAVWSGSSITTLTGVRRMFNHAAWPE